MAQTTVVKITVQELTKYGFKANDRYVGWSKNFKDADKAQVVPGREFEMELYIADSGKEYCNKLFNQLNAVVAPPIVAPVFAKTPTVKPVAAKAVDNSMSKAEWGAKDRSQLIGGLSHDAAALASTLMGFQADNSVANALQMYRELLDGMLKIREEVK